MHEAEPLYEVPGRTYISNRLQSQYSSAKEKLSQRLHESGDLAITTDIWSSRHQDSYLGVTAHFFDSSWQFQSRILDTKPFPENHTAENISKKVDNCLSEWGLVTEKDKWRRVTAIVSDNASNMINAVRDIGVDHMPCPGHTINLAVQAGL